DRVERRPVGAPRDPRERTEHDEDEKKGPAIHGTAPGTRRAGKVCPRTPRILDKSRVSTVTRDSRRRTLQFPRTPRAVAPEARRCRRDAPFPEFEKDTSSTSSPEIGF